MFEKIALFVFEKEKVKKDISVAFVGEQRMRTLNKRFRNVDKSTDVLSFVDIETIVICPAKTDNIRKIFIHGLLHLLGYSHDTLKNAKILERKQNQYLELCQGI